jgi:hypothetical protein
MKYVICCVFTSFERRFIVLKIYISVKMKMHTRGRANGNPKPHNHGTILERI